MARANGITRQEILTSIKYNGTMTAEELSQELHISQVAVRQHLASLEAEKIIAITVERRGLGRPSHRYKLTPDGDETFPRRYEALATMIVEELRDWQGEEAVQSLFVRGRERQYLALANRMRDKPFAAKVQELARFQSENGYMAEFAEGDTPGECRLIQHNCAICAVARPYPHICCKQEMEMLQQTLEGAEIVREEYIMAGDHTCTYRIRNEITCSPDLEPTIIG
jgi:DeoR family suf operon transcriptional repressor